LTGSLQLSPQKNPLGQISQSSIVCPPKLLLNVPAGHGFSSIEVMFSEEGQYFPSPQYLHSSMLSARSVGKNVPSGHFVGLVDLIGQK